MKGKTLLIAFLCLTTLPVHPVRAQGTAAFKSQSDSLRTLLQKRTTVLNNISITKVQKRGSSLDFYFTAALGEYPWRKEDVPWLKGQLKALLPAGYTQYDIGEIYAGKLPLNSLVLPEPSSDGKANSSAFRTRDPRPAHSFIEAVGRQKYFKGLSGRNIALWQSHGRYYEEKMLRWEWQRAPIFQTVEDMYTQSYVLPFLIPMLENAGAYVMTPRERDIQTHEIIIDNDPAFPGPRPAGVRLEGNYSEKGEWKDAGIGFADANMVYTGTENPFRMGSARMADCLTTRRGKAAEVRWLPMIPERGEYSVYISYKSLPNSTECAHYTVHHMGGSSEFVVNQRMGGGTWIYLGTFEFDRGKNGYVSLDNAAPAGRENSRRSVVTADAVRIGGGMGKIARGPKNIPASEYVTSGMPSFAEGAFYWMQWAGADTTLLNLHEDDYTSDYADRGAWVGWMSGGSRTNPEGTGLGIPIDLSFAFHTDAGTSPDDSIVGTLAIYTLMADGERRFPNGEDRMQQRTFADYTQTQIVEDIRRCYEPEWSRRGLWDKSYSESRTATVPAMLLELLSHQNFADMKYGLDPSFRFAVSRAVYKGMLKYLSSRYGCDYVVQPLPVRAFATSFRSLPDHGEPGRIRLSWKATVDSLESTAEPKGYILYTRIDDGAFDRGRVLEDTFRSGEFICVELNIDPGHIYSYRIAAFNDGGESFPSETLSVGVPGSCNGRTVLIVNNFTRVSPPAWFDTPEYAGFDNGLDAGVPYLREINFIGEQYLFRRELPWMDDDSPGFGASYTDQAGKVIPGNTFDFTGIHGKALMKSGYAFHSAGVEAFSQDYFLAEEAAVVDLLCGKQVTTPVGNGRVPPKYQVFPIALQRALKRYTAEGGSLLVSGSNIGTDVWDKVFPVEADSAYTAETKAFVETTLGYRWLTNYATRSATVWPMRNDCMDLTARLGRISYYRERNERIYNVETADGILPASDRACTVLRYTDTNISAATCFEGQGYRTVCLGFPIEVIKKQEDIDDLIQTIMTFLTCVNE